MLNIWGPGFNILKVVDKYADAHSHAHNIHTDMYVHRLRYVIIIAVTMFHREKYWMSTLAYALDRYCVGLKMAPISAWDRPKPSVCV